MPEIQTKNPSRWFADHPGQRENGGKKIQIGPQRLVSKVPEHTPPPAALDTPPPRVDRKCRSAAGNDCWHLESRPNELLSYPIQLRERGVARSGSRGNVAVPNVAVVDVKPRGTKARRARDLLVEGDSTGPRWDAGAMHPAVQVDKQIERNVRGRRGARQRLDRARVIDQR